MTLHLTALTPTYVLQVSDRRLTRLDTRQTYPLANKNVVFAASDGIVTIGYTGPAYLEGVPTDTWIACKLASEDHRPFRDGKGPGMRVHYGRPQNESWPTVEQAVELLRQQTEVVSARLRGDEVMRHQIQIAGWQSHDDGFRLVSWTVENSDAKLRVFVKEADDLEKPFLMSSIPDSALSSDEVEQFNLWDSLWPQGECMKSLVEIVRYVSKRGGPRGPVGPDCMAILLPNPDEEKKCYFRYEPVTEGRADFLADGRSSEVPAAFSPWLVGPGLHAPPAILTGGNFPFPRLGDYEIVGYAPPIPEGGIRSGKSGRRHRGGFFTQKRRRPKDWN